MGDGLTKHRELQGEAPGVQRYLLLADRDIGIKGLAIEHQGFIYAEGVEVRARQEALGHLSSGHSVNLRLPVVFEDGVPRARRRPHGRGGAPYAHIRKVGEQAVAPPYGIDRERPAILLAGRAHGVPPWRPC